MLFHKRFRRGTRGDHSEEVLQTRLGEDFSKEPVGRDKDELSAGKAHATFKAQQSAQAATLDLTDFGEVQQNVACLGARRRLQRSLQRARLCSRLTPVQSPPFCQKCPTEAPQVTQVAPEQATRFLGQPKKPFAASASHPYGRAPNSAGQEIDGAP